MRVVVELKRTADPNVVMEQLYRRTKLQIKFSVNMVTLVGREPRVLGLMDIMVGRPCRCTLTTSPSPGVFDMTECLSACV